MTFFQWINHLNAAHVYAVLLIFVYIYLAERDKLPAVESIRKFTSMLDDTGGNILVLGLLTSWFFVVTVKLFYFAITLIKNGQIKADDAILLMALNTVSSSAFGTSFGALLKTLKGALTVPPPTGAVGSTTQLPRPSPGGEVTATITEKGAQTGANAA
jgi:hypothetical protein